ncbi:MAG: ATP-binding protein [Candidatus Wallbacteria bacterium]
MKNFYQDIINIDIHLKSSLYLTKLLELLCKSLKYKIGVMLINVDGGPDYFYYTYGIDEKSFRLAIGKCGIDKCDDQIKYFSIDDIKNKDEDVFLNFCIVNSIKSFICVPLAYCGKILGRCIFFNARYVQNGKENITKLEYLRSLVSLSMISNHLINKSNEKAQLLEIEINERKKAESLLRTEKERLAVMLKSMGDGVIVTDSEQNVIIMNPAAEKITGYGMIESEGKKFDEIFHILNVDTRKKCDSPIKRSYLACGPVGLEHGTIIISKNGREDFLSATTAPIFENENLIGFIIVFRDITERKKLEAEFLKLSKLESVGILAGGIAHDFNNLLTGIIGNITYAKMVMPPDERTLEVLDKAEDVAFRAKELTSQFRTFSKGGVPIKKVIDTVNLIKSAVEFALRGSNLKSDFEFDKKIYNVEADEVQLNQVVANIVINARHAMKNGGLLKIKVCNVTIDDISNYNSLPLKHGNYVKISFTDTGTGISREDLPKIFDPYFSTKTEGSGLGLTTAFSIISKHGGVITADSELGIGSVFTVYIPATENIVQPDALCAGDYLKPRILLMDDESIIREVTSQLLKHMGYNIDTACDGAEALELYKKAYESDYPFNLVIMDLTVPGGMGGAESMKKILEFDNNALGIISSGYSNDFIMSQHQKYGFKGVISKPYKIRELDEIIKKILSDFAADVKK